MNIERWVLNNGSDEDIFGIYQSIFKKNTISKILSLINGIGAYRKFVHSIELSSNGTKACIMFDQEVPSYVFDNISFPHVYWFGGIVLVDVDDES